MTTKQVPVVPSDVNSYLGGHHCKRCDRDNPQGASDLPGGYTRPAVKVRASCGCWVLYCKDCIAQTWIWDGARRDIFWWHEGYGERHTRRKICCGAKEESNTDD